MRLLKFHYKNVTLFIQFAYGIILFFSIPIFSLIRHIHLLFSFVFTRP